MTGKIRAGEAHSGRAANALTRPLGDGRMRVPERGGARLQNSCARVSERGDNVTQDDRSQPNEFGVIPEDEVLDKDLITRGRDELEDAWFILMTNAHEVTGFEDSLNASPANWLQFWNDDSVYPPHRFREPSRLLHNFLASAITLVDHTRNHMKSAYGEHSFFAEYQQAVNDRFGAPLPQFVHGLRNFTLHYSLPLGMARLSLDPENPHPHTFLLTKTRLVQGFKWSATARAFLAQQEEEFPVSKLVTAYMDVVNSLQHWRAEQVPVLFNRAMLAQHGPHSQIARASRGDPDQQNRVVEKKPSDGA